MRLLPIGFLVASSAPPPAWPNTSVLNFSGADGSTTFTDETGKVWSPFGNVKLSTSDLLAGGGPSVAAFDGSGDYISSPDSDDWFFGNGEFTVEFWFKRTSAGGDHCILSSVSDTPSYQGIQIYLGSTGVYVAGFNSGAGVTLYPAATIDTLYHHYAVSQDATTLRVFQDGVLKGSRAKIIFGDPISTANIGIDWDKTGGSATGRMAGFKATKGLARYTADFTPPSWPFANT